MTRTVRKKQANQEKYKLVPLSQHRQFAKSYKSTKTDNLQTWRIDVEETGHSIKKSDSYSIQRTQNTQLYWTNVQKTAHHAKKEWHFVISSSKNYKTKPMTNGHSIPKLIKLEIKILFVKAIKLSKNWVKETKMVILVVVNNCWHFSTNPNPLTQLIVCV